MVFIVIERGSIGQGQRVGIGRIRTGSIGHEHIWKSG